MPKRPGNVSDEQIIAAYRTTLSAPRAAAVLGLGATTVSRALARNGIKLIGRQAYYSKIRGAAGIYRRPYRGSKERVLQMYRAGMSYKDIARKIARSTHVVAIIVRKAGIARPWRGTGPQHSCWQGGKITAGQGYWKLWVSGDDPMAVMRDKSGYVKEHRLVMARKRGRPLLSTETVHHINGDKADNRPENLELRQGKHGKNVVMYCLDCGSRNIGHASIGTKVKH